MKQNTLFGFTPPPKKEAPKPTPAPVQAPENPADVLSPIPDPDIPNCVGLESTKPRPYPHISIFCTEPEPIDPAYHPVDISPLPHPSSKKAISAMEGDGLVSVWDQHGVMVWIRRDFGNPDKFHAYQPVRQADGTWINMYRKVLGRLYYAHNPGERLEVPNGIR